MHSWCMQIWPIAHLFSWWVDEVMYKQYTRKQWRRIAVSDFFYKLLPGCKCLKLCMLLFTGARAGFFLGDGAGVGKGRQIAAQIKEFWCRRPPGKRRVLWLSTSVDLRWGLLGCVKSSGAVTCFTSLCTLQRYRFVPLL